VAKVVLHIGTHKTATTTIQDMFWLNSPLLAEHGLIYPRLNEFTGHHGLVLNWKEMPKPYQLEGGSLAALEDIAQQYGEGDHTVFLSSEEFSRIGSLRELGRVREALSRFDQIEVICVLRTQWQFLQSVYLEVSKSRVPLRPPELVLPVIKSGTLEGLWVDYNNTLDALEKNFTPAEITLLNHTTCSKAEDGVLGVLLRHLGVNLDPAALEVVNAGASNVSPPSLASWAANILAEPKVAPRWLVDKMVETMRLEFGADLTPCLFTREEFVSLREHFDERNTVLKRRRVLFQPDFAISPSDSTGLHPFRNEVPGSFWLRASRRLVMGML
jgi:hypothetical protein